MQRPEECTFLTHGILKGMLGDEPPEDTAPPPNHTIALPGSDVYATLRQCLKVGKKGVLDVDLAGRHLTDMSLRDIVPALCMNIAFEAGKHRKKLLVRLDVSKNLITDDGVASICEMASMLYNAGHATLESFSAEMNLISDQGASSLASLISTQGGHHPGVLELYSNVITAKGLSILLSSVTTCKFPKFRCCKLLTCLLRSQDRDVFTVSL